MYFTAQENITTFYCLQKVISELQKLFSAKNETYVLKLWPLFVKLLGKVSRRVITLLFKVHDNRY